MRSRTHRERAARRAELAERRATFAAIPGALAKPEAARGTSYRRRERDAEYMRDVKALRCYLADIDGSVCWGAIEADHAGDRGYGRKSADEDCIPLCTRHHRQRTEPARHPGCYFDRHRIVGSRMRAWRMRAIEQTRLAVAALRAARPA